MSKHRSTYSEIRHAIGILLPPEVLPSDKLLRGGHFLVTMASTKPKYYGVKAGKVPGIYTTWAECKQNTDGFKGAIFKSFLTKLEAQQFISDVKVVECKASRAETEYVIFTDGSCIDKKGGYGYVITKGGKIVSTFSESYKNGSETTNNICEMMAILHAIDWVRGNSTGLVEIVTDSKYSIGAFVESGGYKKNLELVASCTAAYKELGHRLRFTHIFSHTGSVCVGDDYYHNDLADKLANEGRMSAK